jgi:nucleoside-diphosphate-sugar epimerase
VGEIAADSMNKPRSLLLWGKRPYRRDEPMWLVGDNRRFTEAVSWQPKVGIAEGIARMIAGSGQFSQS